MKINILSIALIATLLMASVSLMGKDHKRIPNKEAKKWHNNMHNSPYAVYENFDGCVLYYDSIKGKIIGDTHIKFYMGCSNPEGKKVDYRLFYLYITGAEIPLGYTNDFNTVHYFDGTNWIPCKKEMLNEWTTNWKNYLAKIELPYIKAFVVPNGDIHALMLENIYLSFGLKKASNEDTVKLLLSNKKYKGADSTSNNQQLTDGVEVNMDACMPCPKVCGKNEEE